MNRTCVPLVVLLLAGSLAAQDSVRTTHGKLVKGEVVRDDARGVAIIDRMGRIVDVSRREVVRVRKGRGLARRTRSLLEAIGLSTPEALWGVIQEIRGDRALRRDAQRLARRILVAEPDHAGARELLGHARALGVWYPDRKAANKALADEMTRTGHVLHGEAWVPRERLAVLEASPDDWMVDGHLWRPAIDVMRERGFLPWKDAWYPKSEAPALEELARLERRTAEVAHTARVGACRVYSVLGRESAVQVATRLYKVRRWFVERFHVETTRLPLDREPESVIYVLTDQAALSRFVEAYKAELGMKDADLALSLPLKHALWADLGHAIHVGEPIWDAHLVSQLGGSLMNWYWHRGYHLHDWIWNAAAHLAEIAVFGRARVQYVARDRYARSAERGALSGRSIDDFKAAIKEAYEAKEASGLRELFGKHWNALTATDDVMGVALMEFFFERHEEEWLCFLRRTPSKRFETGFKKCFDVTPEDLEQEFERWLGL